jgi:hypothetical protein
MAPFSGNGKRSPGDRPVVPTTELDALRKPSPTAADDARAGGSNNAAPAEHATGDGVH